MSVPTLIEESKLAENRHGNAQYSDIIRQSFHFKTLRQSEHILVYQNGVYKSGGETIIKEECQKIIPDCSTHKCKEVINIIRRETYIPQDQEFDNYDNLINVKNGIIDLETGNFIEHNPKYLFRTQIPVNFDKNATAEQFLKFLDECLPEIKDRITALEAFSSTLLPNVKLEKMFMNVGTGANGKSTYLNVVESFLGSENVSNTSIHDLVKERFAKANLDGKLANIYADISKKEISELGPVKAIISGDSVDVEKKGKDAYKMKNSAKLIYSCNELPEFGESTDALYRRLVLIEWNQQFSHDDPEHKINPHLLAELTTQEELSGILNILIEYATNLRQTGKLTFNENISTLRTKWAEKADPIGTFLGSCVEQDFETKTTCANLTTQFESWCKENKISQKSKKEFNRRMFEQFGLTPTLARIEGKPTKCWIGIRILDQ